MAVSFSLAAHAYSVQQTTGVLKTSKTAALQIHNRQRCHSLRTNACASQDISEMGRCQEPVHAPFVVQETTALAGTTTSALHALQTSLQTPAPLL